MFDLTGKNALVTGASGGIGGEIARALHKAGAVVTLSGTRIAPLEALAAELGERVHVATCDLSDAASVEALPKLAAEKMGSVDVLVNNAGITRDNLFMRMSDDEWQSVIDVNLTSTFRLCRGVLRGMMKARWGRIVNISSVVGATGNPGQGNYAASKAGMVALSRSIARGMGKRGVKAFVVAPGFTRTEMAEDALRLYGEQFVVKDLALDRMTEPEDIAPLIVFLASGLGDHMTGATLDVNAGSYVH